MVTDRIDNLAILGGTPEFTEALHVGRPNIGNRQRLRERFDDMLDRRWLTNDGPLVPEFEAEVARRTGARHCVATCNATAALELAIRALDLHGEVIVPSFTFVAPVHALAWHRVTPVFCDIDADTHLLDPRHVESLVTERTTGILGVHLWGQACNVDELNRIADQNGLTVLLDAAHAFGCSDRGHAIGAHGVAQVFSFHATKIVNSFEGGAVVTNSDELARRLRALRAFGFSGPDRVDSIGVNAKMSEASAAMGLTSIESLDEFIATNSRHYDQYEAGLAGLPAVHIRPRKTMTGTTFHYVVIEVDDNAGVDRDLLLQVLTAEGVIARRYFYPGCHRMDPYRRPGVTTRLPTTERVCTRILQLPTGTAISASDIRTICRLMALVFDHAGDLRQRIAAGRSAP